MAVLFSFTLSLTLKAHAVLITGSGNGGDACEKRFQDIRTDIQNWMAAGGAAGLQLPRETSLKKYTFEMQKAIAEAKISCTDEVVKIGAAEKTCVNHQDAQGEPRVVCNTARFNQTSQADQYMLVHHEFAGVAGLETNQGEESTYHLSRQLTGFLEDVTIKKLMIKSTNTRGRLFICDVENPGLAMFYRFRFFVNNLEVSGLYQDFADEWFRLESAVPGLTLGNMQTIVTGQDLQISVQIRGQISYRASVKIQGVATNTMTATMDYSQNDGDLQWWSHAYVLKCKSAWIDLKYGQDIRNIKL